MVINRWRHNYLYEYSNLPDVSEWYLLITWRVSISIRIPRGCRQITPRRPPDWIRLTSPRHDSYRNAHPVFQSWGYNPAVLLRGCCLAASFGEAVSSHYNDVITSATASQITSLTIIYLTVYSGADQRKHQSSASLAFVWGIHRWPVNSPHKWPVTRKMFPFDDVIMTQGIPCCGMRWRLSHRQHPLSPAMTWQS